MPSAVYPRTFGSAKAGVPSVPTGLMSHGDTGKVQLRNTLSVGRRWAEEYPAIKVGDPSVDKFLAWLRWAWNTQQIFTITLLDTPGSGRSPAGAGGGVPLVNGANQTGSSLVTDGWSHSVTNVVRAGDVIKVNGLNPLFEVLDDADSDGSGNVTLSINPPIAVGSSPADNAAITTQGCTVRACLIADPLAGADVPVGHFIEGLTVAFQECP